MLDFETYPNTFINHGNFKLKRFFEATLKDGEIIYKTKITYDEPI